MKLLNLLETQIERQLVGTLVLGERAEFREIFFEKDQVYLCGDQFSGNVDMAGLERLGILGSRVKSSDLESLLAGNDLRKDLCAKALRDHGLVDGEHYAELARAQIREEILGLLTRNSDTFHFQEKRVPEQLFSADNVSAEAAVPLAELIAELRDRARKLELLRQVLPSRKEVFVVTAEGMAQLQENGQDAGLQRIFGLIDGFRDLGSIIDHSRLYEIYILQRLLDALEKEYLKKTVLPEIRGAVPEKLSKREAESYLPYFKNAVKHAVDAMEARDLLARLYLRLGNRESAIVQYNFIGDALYRMKKPAQAIAAYHSALEIKPDDVMVTDKITRIYQDAAEQELQKGDQAQAIKLLESAVFTRPDDPMIFQRLAEILTESRRIKELAELCDRVIAHAKKMGNPQIGVSACRQVLANVPKSPLFQKKLVNVYLDCGQTQQAALEMATLARIYFERGQTESALDMADKIKRLRNKTPEVTRVHKRLSEDLRIGAAKKSRNAVMLGLGLGMLIVMGAYQGLSYMVWTDIHGTAVAFAQSPEDNRREESDSDAAVRHLEPGVRDFQHKLIANRCDNFIKLFPISFFRAEAEETGRLARQELDRLARERRRRKEKILDEANLIAAEGDTRALWKTLEPLLRLEGDDPAKERARAMVGQIDRLQKSAQEIYDEAVALEREEQWTQAYHLYQKILKFYPSSRVVPSVTLPILVDSTPRGAYLYHLRPGAEKLLLAQTPAVVRLAPESTMAIELASPNHHSRLTEVFSKEPSRTELILDRKPTWSHDFSEKLSSPPFISADLMVLLTDSGVVRARDLATHELVWSIERSKIHRVVGPPLVTPEGIYLVWNDRQVFLVEPGRETPDGAEPVILAKLALEEFAKTPAIALDDGSLVVGTQELLKVFDRDGLQPRLEIPLESTPVSIAPVGTTRLVVETEKGDVFVADTGSGEIVWRKDLDKPSSLRPVRVGPSIVLLTAERDVLILDPESGVPRFVAPLSRGQRICFDPGGGYLLVLDPDGTIRSLSPENGTAIAKRLLAVTPEGLVDLGGRVGVLHEERRRMLVVDSKTLAPVWANRSPRPIERVAASPDHLIAVAAPAGKDEEAKTHLFLFSNKPYAEKERPVSRTWGNGSTETAGRSGNGVEEN